MIHLLGVAFFWVVLPNVFGFPSLLFLIFFWTVFWDFSYNFISRYRFSPDRDATSEQDAVRDHF